MLIFSRTPVLRWLVPVLAAVLLLGGGWAVAEVSASAHETLPPRTAAQLLVDVQQAHLDGLSGTVVQRADLGIPDVPGGAQSSDVASLLSGTHTLRVWLSAPGKARVALLGTLGESDVVVNGRDLWTWSSRSRTATHHTLARPAAAPRAGAPQLGAATPQRVAREVLKRLDPTTRVSSDATTTVAGRAAYQLTLTPRDTRTLVGAVRIAIDGATHVPLRVQVVPRGATAAAFDVGYTRFEPTRPDASTFAFTPPPGAKVTDKGPLASPDRGNLPPQHGTAPGGRVVGQGWSAVLVTRVPPDAASGNALPQQARQVLEALPKVSGSWGHGRLLRGPLFSAVLTDDGRLAAGAVPPELLYQALGGR